MGVTIDGDNIQVPGQIAVVGVPTSSQHVVPNALVGTRRNYVASLNLNAAAPIDLSTLAIDSALYIPLRAFVYKPTANLSSATLGLYTAAGAGGTEIIAPTLLATLTGTGKFQELTISALTSAIVATTIYPRLTVASGVAGTVSLVLEYMDLSVI